MAATVASMKFHKEILSSSQLKLLGQLGPFLSEHGFSLSGGTAIALMLGHRKSVDLDWFTPATMGDVQPWVGKIKALGIRVDVASVATGTLHARANGVRISLLEYPYVMLRPVVEWKNPGCFVASLDDLACMKLSAIAQRGSKKDFIDVYGLMKKHKSLKQMLRLYQKKFVGNDIAPVLYGLAYFDDADKERMPQMIWKIKWPQIRKEILTSLKKSRP
jgi:Nucleotidyl transferase AbiEii toxin, Type IV TA system